MIESRYIYWVVFCVIASMFAYPACSVHKSGSSSKGSEFPIDANKARLLSDSTAEDLVKQDRGNLKAKFQSAIRDATSQDEFDLGIDEMIQLYGQPLQFDFRQEEQGSTPDLMGKPQAVRKYWYAVRTTKHDYHDNHFLIVEIISENTGVSLWKFSIVRFSEGIPESLK